MELRYYQKQSVMSIIQAWKEGETPYANMITGSGKALVLAELSRRSYELGYRVLQLVPRKELCQQNFEETYRHTGIKPGIICSQLGKDQRSEKITIAMVDSFLGKRMKSGKFDILLVDECFTGDTFIETIEGKKRIDEIAIGDKVKNAIGHGIINGISKNKCKLLYKIRLSNGKEIKTTNSHPFFTERGWIKSKDLEIGEILFSIQNMRKLRIKNNSLEKIKKNSKIQKRNRSSNDEIIFRNSFLLDKLIKEERTQFKDSWCYRKNEGHIKKYWSQTKNKRWKRKRTDKISKENDRNTRKKLDSRTTYKDKGRTPDWSVSELLQGRYRESRYENSHRIGWRISSWKEKTDRCKKRYIPNVIRVESIQIEEQSSDQFVYNLSVTGHPSYFANGVLVHNCDLIPYHPNSKYQKIISALRYINPEIRIAGVTGSPYKMKTGDIANPHPVHGKSIFTIRSFCTDKLIPEMIENGHISNIESISGEIQVNTDNVKLTNVGEYDTNIISSRFKEIIPHAVRDMVAKIDAYNLETTLVFASNIENAEMIIDEYKNITGLDNIRLVTGESHRKHERIKNIEWLASSEGKRILVNVDILTRGYNYQKLSCIVFMRATQSLSLYVQSVGRVIRSHDEKEKGYIIDYGGNIDRHGAIDDIKKPQPKESDGKSPKKECLATIENLEVKEINGESITLIPNTICGWPNHNSARYCACCGAEFVIDESAPGKYSMRSYAEILALKEKKKEKTYAIDNVHFDIYTGKQGIPMLKVKYYDGYKLIHSQFLCLNHTGYARKQSVDFLKIWAKSEENIIELRDENMLNVETMVDVMSEHDTMERYFKTVKSITLKSKEDSKYKELISVEFN